VVRNAGQRRSWQERNDGRRGLGDACSWDGISGELRPGETGSGGCSCPRVENWNLCAGRVDQFAEIAQLEFLSWHSDQIVRRALVRMKESLGHKEERLIAAIVDLRNVNRSAEI